MIGKNKQQLHGSNVSINIAEALSARVKDPLWFLAQQWQTGEFEAESGGALADIELQSRHFPVVKFHGGGKTKEVDHLQPLEPVVEAEEADSGDAIAWRSEALEYEFGLQTTGHQLRASNYSGFQLDWYQFELEDRLNAGPVEDPVQNFVPTQMTFRGAPDPRWWRMEEGEAYFDKPTEAEPSVVSTLLPEFFYTDINNWYLIPAPMPSGSIREVTSLRVTDSFGVTTTLDPVDDKDWRVFAVDPVKAGGDGVSGASLFAPNIALDVLYNDVLEDVRFVRDEHANLVWAWEHAYTDDMGETVMNGDAKEAPDANAQTDTEASGYRLMSKVPSNWVPYVPVQINLTPTNGDIFLRRGRTDPDASRAKPQYKSKVVGETTRLMEEEVPRTGLRVRRIKKFAGGAGEGDNHFWVGRHKDAGRGHTGPGLEFDYIEGDD